MTADWISAWATVATVIVAIGGVWVGWIQLSGIKEGLKMNALMAVLEIETQMNERKVHLNQCNADAELAIVKNESKDAIRVHDKQIKSARENYFNALDRLCFCILKDYLSDKDWRADYRNVLMQAITNFPEDFGEASPFRNIKKLNAKWQNE